jgi:GTPase SAR1 family protein
MSDKSKYLMVGLRGSGKTTFLAALWHYLESHEIDGRLSLPQLQPDRDYLNAVRNSWLALKPVGRTSMRANNEISLAVFDKEVGSTIEISLPDLSGEAFRLQWATRKAQKTYVQFAQECEGALLFVHPHEIAQTHVIKPKLIEEEPSDDEESFASIPQSENWSPTQSSTQVQLVDVLQLLLGLREVRARLRLAVVVSAWDVVRAKIPPAVWLEARLPLLSQFVKANSDSIASEIFGVSAQGGDLTRDRGSLLGTRLASLRCYSVRGNSLDRVAFTAPLQYLVSDRELRVDG